MRSSHYPTPPPDDVPGWALVVSAAAVSVAALLAVSDDSTAGRVIAVVFALSAGLLLAGAQLTKRSR